MVEQGIPFEGSYIDGLIRNIYLQKSNYNLSGIHEFYQVLSKANLTNSVILNSKFKQVMSPPNQSQLQNTPISTLKSPAQQTPQKYRNLFDIPGHKRRYHPKDFAPKLEPWIPSQKEAEGFSLLNPLKGYWTGSIMEQGVTWKRTPRGNRPRMLKHYR